MKLLRPTTITRDSFGNWQVNSFYEFDKDKKRVLQVLTMKRYGGTLLTTAKVMELDPTTGLSSFTPTMDFSMNLIQRDIRCTKQAVQAQHAEVNLPYVFEQATSHYAKK